MTNSPLLPGTTVEIVLPVGHSLYSTLWWPDGTVTGTVTRVFKSGDVAVSVHQLANGSKDHFKTMHFAADQLVAR